VKRRKALHCFRVAVMPRTGFPQCKRVQIPVARSASCFNPLRFATDRPKGQTLNARRLNLAAA